MEEIDLKELLLIFGIKKIYIIVITLFFIIAGIVYTYNFVTEDYKSSTTLILGRINSSTSDGRDSNDTNQITQSDITMNSNLISTYSELIKSDTLIKQVIDNLGIEINSKQLKRSITVSRISETELIEITVRNTNAKLASEIANEIAKVFSTKIEEIYNISNVYIIDPAVENNTPYNINHTKDIVIFAALGFIVSCAYILIYSILDNTVKNETDIENEIGLKTLVSIPFNKENDNLETELITYEDVKSVISESFRTLRTNVQFSNVNNKSNKVILITSCFSSEGKSYVSANLAVTFAQTGKKVILIDADMRKGRQSKIFNIPNNLGISNYLSNLDKYGVEIEKDISEFINETEVKNLNLITAGSVPPNPSELLTSGKLPKLVNQLNEVYDLIIFDGAPILPIADSLIITRLANSTILVSEYNRTKKEELNKAKKDIQNVGGRITGVVLNKVNVAGSEYKNKYYYYSADGNKKKSVSKFNFIKNNLVKIFKNKKIDKKPKLLSEKNLEETNLEGKNRDDVLIKNEDNIGNLSDYDKIEIEKNIKKIKEEKEIIEAKERVKKRKLLKCNEGEEIQEEKIIINNDNYIDNNDFQEEINSSKLKDNENFNLFIEDNKYEKYNEIQPSVESQDEIDLEEEKSIQSNKFKNSKIDESSLYSREKKTNFISIANNFFDNIDKKRETFEIKQYEKIRARENETKSSIMKLEEEVAKLIEIRKQMEIDREKKRALIEEQQIKEREENEKQAELERIEREKEEERVKEEEQRRKEREEKNRLKIERAIKRQEILKEQKIRKEIEREERKKLKELQKQVQIEEALIKEQLRDDNLYPKTKYDKNL